MSGLLSFFTCRWRASVPMGVLFWRDLLLVGTLINLLATGIALAMAASGVNIALAAAVHFVPLPYNLFLVVAVWRLPERVVHRWVAVGWLAFVTLI